MKITSTWFKRNIKWLISSAILPIIIPEAYNYYSSDDKPSKSVDYEELSEELKEISDKLDAGANTVYEYKPTSISKSSSNGSGKSITKPNVLKYFNTKEVLPSRDAVAVFIKSENTHLKLHDLLSDEYIILGIESSTTLFDNSSDRFYKQFYSANQSWLKDTNIEKHTGAYLVGSFKEVVSHSSENKKIIVVNLTFSGRLVNLKDNKVVPVKSTGKASSFDKEAAFNDAYRELSKEIVSKTVGVI